MVHDIEGQNSWSSVKNNVCIYYENNNGTTLTMTIRTRTRTKSNSSRVMYQILIINFKVYNSLKYNHNQ